MFSKSAWVLAVTVGVVGCHDADTKSHEHAHADPSTATSGLRLDNGKKWPTDEPLRAGMTGIRNELQTAVKPIHAKTYSPEEYTALGAKIQTELGNIVQNCKLPKEVDDQLHLVLAQISAGADQMKKDGDRMGGALKVIGGLEAYAKYFEHPDWKPIEH